MRKHRFTRADLERWKAQYGMPVVYKEPTIEQIEELTTWRRATTLAGAWRRFQKAAEAADAHAEVPDAQSDRYDNLVLHTWGDSRVTLICEKGATADVLWAWNGKRPSFAYQHRAGVATASWLPLRPTIDAIAGYASSAHIPLMWIGDLDPQALHSFATVRAGGRAELFDAASRKLRVAYLGLDSTWLDWIDQSRLDWAWMTIRMRHVDREYWNLAQRLVPDARALIGARASKFLDEGNKIEVDALLHSKHRAAFLRELGRRLRAARR